MQISKKYNTVYWGPEVPEDRVDRWKSSVPPLKVTPPSVRWVGPEEVHQAWVDDAGQLIIEMNTRPARFVRLQIGYDGSLYPLWDAGNPDGEYIRALFERAGAIFSPVKKTLPVRAFRSGADDDFAYTYVAYEHSGAYDALAPLIRAGLLVVLA